MFIQQTCSKCKGILVPLENKERVEVIEKGKEVKQDAASYEKQIMAEQAAVPGETEVPEREIKQETVRREEPKVGRNDPCPCGSGKKYKHCCGRNN